MTQPILYLAGGFRSGWQDAVVRRLTGMYEIRDPRTHGLESPPEYTAWDLSAIQESTYFLGYMEASNPGGYALALEAGYAHALGKVIIFVNEVDQPRRKHFEMVEAVSTFVLPTLGEAIDWLAMNCRRCD